MASAQFDYGEGPQRFHVHVIDEATGLCQGCLRTIAEIASWSRLTNPERRRIMAELPSRKAM